MSTTKIDKKNIYFKYRYFHTGSTPLMVRTEKIKTQKKQESERFLFFNSLAGEWFYFTNL